MKFFKTLLIVAMISLAISPPAFAQKDPVYTGVFSNLALQGYDPVTYFTKGEPIKGLSDFMTQHMGAQYRFLNETNLELFISEPEKYTPQYGGYCAWAVAQGNTAKGNARYWKIVEGKLYLNFNDKIQKRWEQDIDGFISKADVNWPDVLSDD